MSWMLEIKLVQGDTAGTSTTRAVTLAGYNSDVELALNEKVKDLLP